MTIMSKFKDKLKAMDAAGVDRVLWQLKMFCIEEVEGYAEYRATVEETTPTAEKRQEKKDLEEIAEIAAKKFKRRRLDAIAEDRAEEQFERWQARRAMDTAQRDTLRELFRKPA